MNSALTSADHRAFADRAAERRARMTDWYMSLWIVPKTTAPIAMEPGGVIAMHMDHARFLRSGERWIRG